MKKRILWLGLSFLLVAALVLTSCGEALPGEQEEEEEEEERVEWGTIEVRVTDAPGNVTAIEVTVSEVEVHKEVAGEGEWTSLAITGPNPFDLIKIKNKEQELITQDIDTARYTQIRMTVEMVEVTYLEDGVPTTKEATIPSGELKFVRPFDVVEGGTTTLIIDFDADKSVVFAGADKVIFKPVVKLAIEHEVAPAALEIATGLPDGQVGVAYSATLGATGGTEPYTWVISAGLPDGLTLDSDTGVISGIPTTEEDYDFTVQVEDSSAPTLSATEELSINIIGP